MLELAILCPTAKDAQLLEKMISGCVLTSERFGKRIYVGIDATLGFVNFEKEVNNLMKDIIIVDVKR